MTELPRYIEVETSRYCNRSCQWCPNGVTDARAVQELMVWSLLSKIVGELKELKYSGWLALHNYNEPLANPRLNLELAYLHDQLPHARPSIFTNGDLLDHARLASLVQAGVAYLRVMIYPSRRVLTWDAAAAAVTVSRWLHARHLEAIGEWSYGNVRQGFAATCKLGSLTIEVIRPDVSRYNWRGGQVSDLAGSLRTSPCYMTQNSASIDYRGNLKMCCNVYTDSPSHQEYIIGNLNEGSFRAFWNSDRMTILRRLHESGDWRLSSICRHCTQQLPTTGTWPISTKSTKDSSDVDGSR